MGSSLKPYPRRILLAVTGLSPQIVTETLYALACQVPNNSNVSHITPFIPTEIHLLSTSEGEKLARTALLHPDGGQFHALLADYPQLGQPVFNEDHIHTIKGPDGLALSDIRTPEENACAADSIIALLQQLTKNEDAALHVSIAGGRKTMGFYLGYAFSLFAREQDTLSHVLVSAPFENHPEFFFPPKIPKRLATRDGRHIDTAEAEVTLAHIPVVRLREPSLEAALRANTSYSQVVQAIQDNLRPAQLRINLKRKEVCCGDLSVSLPPHLLTTLAWFAENTLQGQPLQCWSEANFKRYLDLYRRVVGKNSEHYNRAEERVNTEPDKFFQQNNSKLNKALQQILGLRAQPYLLKIVPKGYKTQRGQMVNGQQLTLSAYQINLIID